MSLMASAYWGAAVQASRAKREISTQEQILRSARGAPSQQADTNLKALQALDNPCKGTSDHADVSYSRKVNSMAVCLVLLWGALSLFLLWRPGGRGGACLVFSTEANFAFLTHLYACVLGIFGAHFDWISPDVNPPPRVAYPASDTLIAVWWTATWPWPGPAERQLTTLAPQQRTEVGV
jgi:hypothetical protein